VPRVFLIPVGDDVRAVGVERGHEQNDHIVEDPLDLRRVLRSQFVSQFGRGERPADFGRVNAARDDDHGLSLAEQFIDH